MSVTVELIYDDDCPNVEEARANLRRALERAGTEVRWLEWNRADPEAPERARCRGSPSVLVNGRDVVAEAVEAEGRRCRVYEEGGTYQRAPSIETLVDALRRAAAE